MSNIDRLPRSQDVAAEIAKHVAEARRLRTLFRTLRRLETEKTEPSKPEPSGGDHVSHPS